MEQDPEGIGLRKQGAGEPDTRRAVLAVLAVGVAAGFLLGGYEFVRSVSTSLFVEEYTAERLPVAMALMPVGVLLTLYGYGVVLSRVGPSGAADHHAVVGGSIWPATAAPSPVGTGGRRALRLPRAYIVLIIEQHWSLINSTLTPGLAKRLNGPITGLGSMGAIIGAKMVGLYAERVGPSCLAFAAASLLPAALCSSVAYRLAGEPAGAA